MNKPDYETEDVIAEMKVSVSKEKLKQMELYLLSIPKAIGITLVNEDGSVMVWMEKKSNIKPDETCVTPEKFNLKLKFKFSFPPIYGMYDTGNGTIYIFGESEEKIEDVLSHETLHFVIQIIAGNQASLDLDNVCREWLK